MNFWSKLCPCLPCCHEPENRELGVVENAVTATSSTKNLAQTPQEFSRQNSPNASNASPDQKESVDPVSVTTKKSIPVFYPRTTEPVVSEAFLVNDQTKTGACAVPDKPKDLVRGERDLEEKVTPVPVSLRKSSQDSRSHLPSADSVTLLNQENLKNKDLTSFLDKSNPQSLWESWELDIALLREIEEWKLKHPYTKLINFFKNICSGIDEESVFLELIPDGAIPIRGLVKSLLYICRLGTNVAWAKDKVIEFMEEIVPWLENLAYTFNIGGMGEHEREAWRLLSEMGQLIKDACHWARDLLSSSVTSSQRLSVESDIQNYRTRFTRISERFGVISAIRSAQGFDDLKHIAMKTAESQDAAKRLAFLEGKLRLPVIEHAFYKHQEKRPCEAGTRLDVLEEIRSWFQDTSENSQCFYWLSGEPGVGKSAITVSLAKECIDLDILGAQFFINRNDEATTDPRVLFPTICWQLCQRFPLVAIALEKILRAQPTLVDDISDGQATKLFVNAIETAAQTDQSKTVVIVIDALDETDMKRLRDLAQIFSKIVANLPRNSKVFISSRTEDAITKPFNPLCNHKQVKSKYLAAKDSIEEVSRFVEDNFKKILQENDMDWADWEDENRRLSSQASGLYIWAETTLKFLRDEIENSGTSCVGGLLRMLTTNGMDDIYTLYSNILRKRCKDSDWEHQRFHRIVGAILVRQAPLSIDDIAQLLELRDPIYSNPVDLVHFVRQYRTILVSDTREINGRVVPRMHRSFADFITSQKAQEFRVDKRASHGEIALQCIDKLCALYAYLKKQSSLFPVAQLTYVSQYWQSHLTKMVQPDFSDGVEEKNGNDELNKGDDTQRLLVPANPHGEKDLETVPTGFIPLLAFSLDGTQVALSEGDVIGIMDARTWSTTQSLAGHRNNVTSIGFSPDGTQLVSASWDQTARIWDVRTGRDLHVLRGHTSWVQYAGFSHDGKMVVTSSHDSTLRTWDSSTGQPLNVFKHMGIVHHCTFSPNDQRIASSSWFEIMVWDVNSGSLISKIKHDRFEPILFCPCGNHIMSRGFHGEIKLWDAASGNQLDYANSTIASLAIVQNSEGYVEIEPALSAAAVDSSTPYMYTLKIKTQRRPLIHLHGIVEHGQGFWVSGDNDPPRIFSAAGATRVKDLATYECTQYPT